GAAVVVALVGGLSAALWGFFTASEQRDVARKEATRSHTVLELVDDMLSSADPHALKGKEYKVRQLLDDFDRKLGTRLQSEPEVDASVHRLLGRAYLGLGLTDKAAPHLDGALSVRRRLFGNADNQVAVSLVDEAKLMHDRGEYAPATGTLDEARRIVTA